MNIIAYLGKYVHTFRMLYFQVANFSFELVTHEPTDQIEIMFTSSYYSLG